MFTVTQILLVTLFLYFMFFIRYSVQLVAYGEAVFYGFVVGLIMGDVKLGLYIGGQLCLMGLGVVAMGGSSVPDYAIGTTVGVVFAVATGGGIEAGLAVGIPVATLGVYLDIFVTMIFSFFLHKAQACAEKANWKGMNMWIWASNWVYAAVMAAPVFLAMTIGADLITNLVVNMPEWLISGLSVAAGMLPAVGFAILLRFMPIKKYGVFAIFGFVMAAYLGVDMLAITLLAFVAAFMIYNGLEDKNKLAVVGGGNDDE
jgi:Phosphotransferase system, mannose/fructose/N-acetylgalactosamine-specific component IIC